MDRTSRLLFILLRAGLGTSAAADVGQLVRLAPAPAEWEALAALASAQGLLAIVWDGLQRLDSGRFAAELPRDLRLRWGLNVRYIEERWERQRRVVSDLARFFARHGLEMMVLKGCGLSICYPVPEHRPCGDIDIWMCGRQREADELLRREKSLDIDTGKHHHTVFTIDGISVENHYDFLNVQSHKSNRELETLLKRLAARPAERLATEGAELLLPCADFNALFLLRHAGAHFAAHGIGLRHVADWAMFARRCRGDIDWPFVERIAAQHNMERFMRCLNTISSEYLGAESGCFPAAHGDPLLAERILGDILHPEFSEPAPARGRARIWSWKLRRWRANRWKHRIVYRDGLAASFVTQLLCHITKPGIQK